MQRKESFKQAFSSISEGKKVPAFFKGLSRKWYASGSSLSIIFHFLPAFVFLVSCSAARQAPVDNLVSATPVQPKILFLVFSIEKDSILKKTSVSLRSKLIKEGEIKQKSEEKELFPNYLTIDYYEDDKLKSSFNVEHPLYKNVEYFDGNELVTKFIELNQSDFFIRLRSQSENGSIVIYETKGNTRKTKLLTQKL